MSITSPFFSGLRGGALALGLLAAPVAQAQGFDFDNLSPEDRAAFGAQVRAYLMENPQVIMDAVAELERMQAAQQENRDAERLATYADQLENDGYSWIGGNPEGSVTVIEFMDYRCGYCRKAAPEVEALVETDDDIRLIVKEFPILGEASMVSSRFAIATKIVAGDEAYKDVHDGLIALEGNPGEPQLRRLASTLNLDADAIIAEMNSDEVTRRIEETRELAMALEINGTPSFVFGDTMVRGYAPLDTMMQIVDQERATQ